ncbi:DinB family protein [Jiulongibacter sediminis]|uniref:Damage-inducible protein DinB n=1 Tax=Jiulongibacter sediminis TaxID=1605367 RepID=A0A0P7C647_9BACT|nr:DinB family protein [Jiulongibacter sediminis]KPM49767.1 damage-inducible protein DinB [Jiulongibacter sediminis]TBX26804.1 damage-inducible protein DinB [Jiulongibacter sediminis]
MKRILTVFALTVFSIQMVYSQTAKDWERAKAYTLEYLETMPVDKYDLKPTPEMRTFAQQLLHLTDANYGFTAAATGAESPMGMGANEKAEDQSKENVIKLVMAGYDFVIANAGKLSAAQLEEKITLFGRFEMTRGEALNKLFEHQTHHRGQTTVYIRLGGATPPQEKLF